MGASKRVAEIIVRDAARRSGRAFVAVRFGNVLGSRGSVVPHFKRQIEAGGPITITHPEMTRFFMTIPEAVHLTLQAGGLGSGGELFVLNMGKPVRILDLAQDLIKLSGYEPGEIPITYTGIRPGEKLHEALWERDAVLQATSHPDIMRVEEAEHPIDVPRVMTSLEEATRSRQPSRRAGGAGAMAGDVRSWPGEPENSLSEVEELVKVVVLAGGMGTRLAEETEVRPKPMIEIGGRPILWHILKHYAHFGFREFLIALGYRSESIKRFFCDYHELNGDLTVTLGSGEVERHVKAADDWIVHLTDTGSRDHRRAAASSVCSRG